MQWVAGTKPDNDLTVQSLLGSGGMGEVYRVTRETPTGIFEYAAKKLSRKKQLDDHFQAFLQELRTWIDLPEHPHIVECFFYRTIGDQLVVFSECVNGGTLRDWIRGGRIRSSEQIIEIILQIASGLQTAHDCGVIHQDVKSGNILMTATGIPKITDFGISGLKIRYNRSASGDRSDDAANETTLVTSHGLTPAFGSPEQFQNERLSRTTDIWSLGVVMFEMYHGSVEWQFALQVPDYLDKHRRESSGRAIPEPVAHVIMKCLEFKPEKRWQSMHDFACALKDVHEKLTGKKTVFTIPCCPSRTVMPDRNGIQSQQRAWLKAVDRLKSAYDVDGQKPSDCKIPTLSPYGSSFSRALETLGVYSLAVNMYRWHIEQGRSDLLDDFADMMTEKAKIHHQTDDYQGAMACYSEAACILDTHLKDKPEDPTLLMRSGDVMMQIGNILQRKDPVQAKHMLEKALKQIEAAYDRIPAEVQSDRILCLEKYANVQHNLANACVRNKELDAAMDFYNKGIANSYKLAELTGQPEQTALPLMLSGRANLNQVMNPEHVENDCLTCIALLEKKIRSGTDPDSAQELFRVSLLYGRFLTISRRYPEAMKIFDRAETLLNTLIELEGRRYMLKAHSMLLYQRARCMGFMDRKNDALHDVEKSIQMLEKLIYQYSNHDCEPLLKIAREVEKSLREMS